MSTRRDTAIVTILIAFGVVLSGAFVILAATDNADPNELLPAFSTQHQFQDFVTQSQSSNIWKDYAPEAISTGASSDSVRHSTTNVQVEGVDEADSVKTDGEYLYIATGDTISIIKAYPPESLSNASTINIRTVLGLGDNYSVWMQGIYLDQGMLVAVVSVTGPYLPVNLTNGDQYRLYAPSVWRMPEEKTVLAVFSLSGDEEPTLKGTVAMSGYCVTSRLSGGLVYVVAQHYLWSYDSKVTLPKEWSGNDSATMAITDVHYDPDCRDPAAFLNIMALDISDMESNLTSIVTGYASTIYVSSEAIYLTFQTWTSDVTIGLVNAGREASTSDIEVSSDSTMTTIYKIGLEGLKIKALARGEVPGYLLNQFSMDESDGLLRVATTFSWDNQRNAVYVLDGNLSIIGALEDLAPDERIYSCRFSGDTLYLVTFRQVDPLFVIDLSNPLLPKVQGELKVPGFSSYLHPIGIDRLVGIGMQNGSLKLSLFDVSDPNAPLEMISLVVPYWSYSEALWDHKAITYDPVTMTLIIPVSSWDANSWNCTSGAYVFHIGEGSIQLRGIVSPGPGEYTMRAQFIGDWLYTISDTTVYINSLIDLSGHSNLVYRNLDYSYLPILMAEGGVSIIGAVR